ncbi:MAG: 30S ribosomal protein S17 [Acidobacteriota bacterium]|nr:30S ribosomal protein S17 [Acidobacteriota bacterium]
MAEQTSSTTRGRRQELVGVIVSTKMDKTVVVKVEKTIVHGLYHRYMKRNTRYYAHDSSNQCGVGDRVEIVASRPMSKLKRWRVQRVLKKSEGV